ncbi:lysozyme inhibitor LprI family protein [Virgibacillus kimchii]
MKQKISLVAATLLVMLLGLYACSNTSDEAISSSSNQAESEKSLQIKDGSSQSKDTNQSDGITTENNNGQAEDTHGQTGSTDRQDSTDTSIGSKEIEVQEGETTDTVSKVEGRRAEFLERLENIQKELDALPEKKDADKGVTNAMKSYYGRSYEMYDEELNEIYALLQKELAPETMKELKTKQIQWIEEKEKLANEARQEYNGGTFENVAYYISLYESTKERCYELVNKYMTD